MTKEEVISVLKEKPYLLLMGANKVARQLKTDADTIRIARSIVRKNMKEFGTTYHPKEVAFKKSMNMPKIVVLDIETSPMKAFVWKRWKENVSLDQTISEWFMLCWTALFINTGEIVTGCVTGDEALNEDDSRISEKLWHVLNDADIVIAHNGKKFDIPKINSRFIVNGLKPTSAYMQIDTLEVCKKQFGFSSNKLDALAGYFGIDHKSKTDFDLWRRCLNGEQDALNYMLEYNIKDVLILEEVYYKLRPWIKSHPNYSLFTQSNEHVCPNCGSSNLYKNGNYYTNTGIYTTYRCDNCDAISRTRKSNLINKNILVGIPGR